MSSRSLFPSAASIRPEPATAASASPLAGAGDGTGWFRGASYRSDLATVPPVTDDAIVRSQRKKTKPKPRGSKKRQRSSSTCSSSEFSDDDNGGTLVVAQGAIQRSDGDLWRVDRGGDSELQYFGNAYRLDVPVYTLRADDGDGCISSDELARHAYAMPSGLVSTGTKAQGRMHVDKKRRYHSAAATAPWRSLSLPVWRRRPGGATGAAATDLRPLPSFMAAPVDPFGPADAAEVSTDTEYFRGILVALQRQMSNIRGSEQASAGVDPVAWLGLCSAQEHITELQQLVSGAMTKSYRRGYSSTMTSTALRGCAPLRAYLGGVATAAAARDRQVAVLEEAMRQGPSPAPRSAVLLYARLLALLRVSATSTSAEAVARLHRDLKEQFPMSCTAMELEQASLRGAFEKCTVTTLRDAYFSERRRIEEVHKNARSSRQLLGDLRQANLGLGFERAQDEKKHVVVVENFYSQLLCEKEAGCTETLIAKIQCILDLNFCLALFFAKTGQRLGDDRLIDEICSFWDSEAPRLGELCGADSTHPPSTDVPDWCDSSRPSQACSILALGSVDWVANGRPEDGLSCGGVVSFWEDLVEKRENVKTEYAPSVKDEPARAECVETEARSIDSESFAVKFLNDWFLKDELASQDASASRDPQVAVGEGSAPDAQLVYSSVHGYRIPKPTVSDTSSAYRNILRDLKGDGGPAEKTSSPWRNASNDVSGAQLDLEITRRFDGRASAEEKASLEQFMPLRLQCQQHARLLERQPDRAVFADDIRQSMFLVTSKTSRARLIARCLSGLGVTFPNSEICSSSGLASCHRRTSSACQDSLLCATSILQTRMASRQQGSWNGPAEVLPGLLLMLDCSSFSVQNKLDDAFWSFQSSILCPVHVDVEVLRQYAASRDGRLPASAARDSLLDFTLRLLSRLLMLPLYPEGRVGDIADEQLPFPFVSDLYCTLLRLLAVRYVFDLALCSDANPVEQSMPAAALREKFRESCRYVLQHSSERGCCDGRLGSSSAQSAFADIESSVWSVYVETESTVEMCEYCLGVSDTSSDYFKKMSTKIMKTMVEKYTVSFAEKTPHAPRMPGGPADCMAALEESARGRVSGSALNDDLHFRWVYSLFMEVPGFASLVTHTVLALLRTVDGCLLAAVVYSSESVRHDSSAAVAEMMAGVQMIAEIASGRRFLSVKDILKLKKKKESKKSNKKKDTKEEALCDVNDAVCFLRQLMEFRCEEMWREVAPSGRPWPPPRESATEREAQSVVTFQAFLDVEPLSRLNIAPPEFNICLLLVWLTYFLRLPNDLEPGLSSFGAPLPPSISNVLELFDDLLAWVGGLVRAAASCVAQEEATAEMASPRRLTKIRIALQQWGSFLLLLLRSKVEYLNHVEKTYCFVTDELHRGFFCWRRGSTAVLCRPPFTPELRREACRTLEQALQTFPNDTVLLGYVVAYSTPGVWKMCSPLLSSWGARLCDDVISKLSFMTGCAFDDIFPLWETSARLRLFQVISRSRGCAPHVGTSLLCAETLFERVSFELERFIELSPTGSKAVALIWSMYIEALCARGGGAEDVRRLYYRAIHQCPWSKRVWILAMSPRLRGMFKVKELEDLWAVMEEKGVVLRAL